MTSVRVINLVLNFIASLVFMGVSVFWYFQFMFLPRGSSHEIVVETLLKLIASLTALNYFNSVASGAIRDAKSGN